MYTCCSLYSHGIISFSLSQLPFIWYFWFCNIACFFQVYSFPLFETFFMLVFPPLSIYLFWLILSGLWLIETTDIYGESITPFFEQPHKGTCWYIWWPQVVGSGSHSTWLWSKRLLLAYWPVCRFDLILVAPSVLTSTTTHHLPLFLRIAVSVHFIVPLCSVT